MGLFKGFLRGSGIRHYSAGFLKFMKESQQVQLPAMKVSKLCVGMSTQDFPSAAGSVARFSTLPHSDFEFIRKLLEEVKQREGSSAKHASGGQKPPSKPVIVSQPFPLKKTSALFDIINELESVAKPYPNLAIPNDYFIREYLGQKLPMFEKVRALASHQGDLVFELRLDVWPIPDYCMLHGIWPCYIHKSGWIIYSCPDDTIDTALATKTEAVIEEISNLHPQIKKTLHKIWKSYSLYRKNAEARDKYFWAHEKIVHCWDDAGFLPGENFNTTAKIGDAVRSTLLRWMVKSDIRPNHFYDSVVWREGMHDLYDADVHLVIKKDYGATKLTYLEGMGLLMKVDNTESGVSLIDYPCLVSSSGKFFLLM